MKRSNGLPKEIRDSLRRIVKFSGNEKAVDEDPVKVLSMLLYAIERELDVATYTILKALVREYCSSDGLVRFSHKLQERKNT